MTSNRSLRPVVCMAFMASSFAVPCRAQDGFRTTSRRPVDTLQLKVVEKRVLPAPIVRGPAKHGTILDYYIESNDELVYRARRAREVFETGSPRPFRMITLISGSAGVGKTFLKSQVASDEYPASDVCKFDIREVYSKWKQEGRAFDKPDLQADGIVLNTMPAMTDNSWPGLYEYLSDQQAAFYIIDSLDEVHPDDYVSVLDQVERFAFNTDSPFVHVVVLGRGLAFRDYWQKKAGYYPSSKLNLYMLEPAYLATTGDLTVSSWNYHGYFHKLAWASQDAGKFTLQDFVDWQKQDFRREGRFADVKTTPDGVVDVRAEQHVVDLAQRHPFVVSALRNLAGNSLLRGVLQKRVSAGLPYDEQAVKLAYFDAWLERDTRSDDRPSAAKPEHLDLYMRLLEGIAVRYAGKGQIDSRGFFTTQDEHVIEVDYHGRKLAFPIYRVLNRSGLKYVDPRTPGSRRYRFEPIWLHRFLVDVHNERIQSRSQGIAIWIDADAEIRVGDSRLTFEELSALLSEKRSRASALRLDVDVDHRAPFEHAVKVIRAANEARVSDIHLRINGRPLGRETGRRQDGYPPPSTSQSGVLNAESTAGGANGLR